MGTPRRKFLLKGAMGLLGAGLSPTLVHYLTNTASHDGVQSLISTFALKPVSLSFENVYDALSGTVRPVNGQFLKARQNLYFQEHDDSRRLTAYVKTDEGLRYLICLEPWETQGVLKMANRLMRHQENIDRQELSDKLLPATGTPRHTSSSEWACNGAAVPEGYFTNFGYCTIKAHCDGSYMTVQVQILNKRRQLIEKLNWQDRFNAQSHRPIV